MSFDLTCYHCEAAPSSYRFPLADEIHKEVIRKTCGVVTSETRRFPFTFPTVGRMRRKCRKLEAGIRFNTTSPRKCHCCNQVLIINSGGHGSCSHQRCMLVGKYAAYMECSLLFIVAARDAVRDTIYPRHELILLKKLKLHGWVSRQFGWMILWLLSPKLTSRRWTGRPVISISRSSMR